MSGTSDSESAKGILIEGLGDWIRLLRLPAGGRYYVRALEDIRTAIARDDSAIRTLLLTSDIWGGMGSFLDSATPRYESGIPSSADPAERAVQWEETNREMHRWHCEFSAATIQVGAGLIDWCRENGGIEARAQRAIENWTNGARRYLEEPYRPLDAAGIDCLEHNMTR